MHHSLVRDALRDHLAPCGSVLAMWEGGSAAFGRTDEYSDLDIGLLCRTGTNDEVWNVVDRAFDTLGGVVLRWSEPATPLFEGRDMRVFRPCIAGKGLQVDIGLFPDSAPDHQIQPERHGEIVVVFDHEGRLKPVPWDHDTHQRRMQEALHQEIMKWQVYHGAFRKELARGRSMDAFASYIGASLRPLVTVLGMRYSPKRWDLGMRFFKEDMHLDVVQSVERPCYLSVQRNFEQR